MKGITVSGPLRYSGRADPNKAIAESNEKNNDKRIDVKDPCFKPAR